MDVVSHEAIMINQNLIDAFILLDEVSKIVEVVRAMKEVFFVYSSCYPVVYAGWAFLSLLSWHVFSISYPSLRDGVRFTGRRPVYWNKDKIPGLRKAAL